MKNWREWWWSIVRNLFFFEVQIRVPVFQLRFFQRFYVKVRSLDILLEFRSFFHKNLSLFYNFFSERNYLVPHQNSFIVNLRPRKKTKTFVRKSFWKYEYFQCVMKSRASLSQLTFTKPLSSVADAQKEQLNYAVVERILYKWKLFKKFYREGASCKLKLQHWPCIAICWASIIWPFSRAVRSMNFSQNFFP